jgi:aspartyl-tRNA(Asn)/glutamyl-tRNA(Gln) amidotransferase subunit A
MTGAPGPRALTPDHVRQLAAALGVPASDEDVAEVTHRLNGFLEALAPLAELPLDAEEPVPMWPAPPGSPAAADRPWRGLTPAAAARGATSVADIAYLGALEQASLLRDKRVSPVELVRGYLERIERLDGRLRAYIAVRAEAALAEAREAEAAGARGAWRGPLHGIPFAVTDQFDAAGMPTTAGSRLLAARVATADATVVARLRAAGGILLGKLNLSEFALGNTVEFPFGQPRNPWDTERDPGGSSGGSGIAAAAALASVTLGEDTGGSVRSPAGFNGVVGLRPTWGRVSRHGCVALSWSMDAPGPIARTVADCALLTGLIAGHDPGDPLTSDAPVPDYVAGLGGGVSGVRVGVIRELVAGAETDGEVRAAVLAAADALARAGAIVEEISLPLLPLAGAAFMALADSEGAGGHLAWLRARPGDFDRGTRRRLLTAGLLPTALYHQAQRGRALIRAQLRAALAGADVLLSPTAPRVAARIADMRAPIASAAAAAGRFFTRRAYTPPASLAGVPALSLPCGFSGDGLPIGLHLTARPFEEGLLLRVAHAFEQATDWHLRRPPVD